MTVLKTPQPFGARLRAERERQGLSQTQLAERVGITQVELSRFESGRRRCYLDTAKRLAEALGLTLGRLT